MQFLLTAVRRSTVASIAIVVIAAGLFADAHLVGRGLADSIGRPTIHRVAVGAGGIGLVEGSSTPGTHVVLRTAERRLGHALTDGTGKWRVAFPGGLSDGEHALSAAIEGVDRTAATSSDIVRISIPAGSRMPVELEVPSATAEAAQRQRASRLAEDASRHFDELMPRIGVPRPGNDRVAQAGGGAAGGDKPAVPPRSAQSPPAEGNDLLGPVWRWLERASRQYQSVVVERLKERSSSQSEMTAQRPSSSAPPAATAQQQTGREAKSAPEHGAIEQNLLASLQDSVLAWFERANKHYKEVIVRRLSEPSPSQGPATVARAPEPAASPPVAPPTAATPTDTKAATIKDVEDAARKAELMRRQSEGRRLIELAEKEQRRIAEAKAAKTARSDTARPPTADPAEADARQVAEAARAKVEADLRANAETERLAAVKRDLDRKAAAAKAAEEQEARAEAQRLAALKHEQDRKTAAAKAAEEQKARAEAQRLAVIKQEQDRKAAAAKAAEEQKARAEALRLAALKQEHDRKAVAAKAAEEQKARAEAQRLAALQQEPRQDRKAADRDKAQADAERRAAIEKRKIESREAAALSRQAREDRKSLAEERRLAAIEQAERNAAAAEVRRAAKAKAPSVWAEGHAARTGAKPDRYAASRADPPRGAARVQPHSPPQRTAQPSRRSAGVSMVSGRSRVASQSVSKAKPRRIRARRTAANPSRGRVTTTRRHRAAARHRAGQASYTSRHRYRKLHRRKHRSCSFRSSYHDARALAPYLVTALATVLPSLPVARDSAGHSDSHPATNRAKIDVLGSKADCFVTRPTQSI